MTLQVYDWSLAGPGEQHLLQIARFDFPANRRSNLHTHNGYAEATWVIGGSGQHEWNGERHAVVVGDLMAITESAAHRFIAGPDGMAVLNAACHVSLLASARDRLVGLGAWPWQTERGRWALGVGAQARLAGWAAELLPHQLDEGDGIAFLADLVRILQRVDRRGGERPPPPWLTAALRAWSVAEAWHDGPGAFAARCGYHPDHVNRVVRDSYGCTTATLLQRHRLDRAAALLRLSDRSVLDIALSIGFSNQGHFHKSFKQRFGITPRGYRVSRQMV